MLIDGPITTQTIDSSGEILDLKGLDISDFLDGKATANFEHNNDNADDVLGWFIYAKKIFSEADCENDRQRMFWDKVKTPFLYGVLELLDDASHPGAIAVAAMLRYFKKKNEPVKIGMSIEGSTLERDGHILKRTVGRKVAITLRPCNKQCMLDVLPQERTDELIQKMESDHIQSFEVDSPILEKSEFDEWSTNPDQELRDKISAKDKKTHLNDLKKLSKLTKVRINPKTNQKEFLLHRGIQPADEYGHTERKTSWTPIKDVANTHANYAFEEVQESIENKNKKDPYDLAVLESTGFGSHPLPMVLSRWIPEKHIHYIGLGEGLNPNELEIIVNPGNFNKENINKSEENLIDDIKQDLINLRKTLTAGMGNAAPSMLTGGSALATEDKRHKTNVNVLKSVIRDFQGKTKEDFKKAVKEALPDLSDKYVDHFINLAEDLSLKKFKKRLY